MLIVLGLWVVLVYLGWFCVVVVGFIVWRLFYFGLLGVVGWLFVVGDAVFIKFVVIIFRFIWLVDEGVAVCLLFVV